MNKRHLILLAVLAVSLVLTSCTLPMQMFAGANDSALIVDPLSGATANVGDVLMIDTVVSLSNGAASATLLVNGAAARTDELQTPLASGDMLQGWQPMAEGSYDLQTVFTRTDGQIIESNVVTVIVGPGAQADQPTSAVAAPSPTTATEPSVTPEPTLGPLTAMATVDANCRFGPATVYDVLGFLLTGESSLIVGRSDPAGWWVIENLDAGGNCWIADSVVDISGDTSGVPVVAPPPTPTPTFTPTPAAPPTPIQVGPKGGLKCPSSVDLQWEPVDHPLAVTYEWIVEWNNGYQWDLQDAGESTGSSQTVIVGCGFSYRWRIRAVDANGNASPWSGNMEFETSP